MYLVIYDRSGEVDFQPFDDKDTAVGFALRKHGYVVNAEKPGVS